MKTPDFVQEGADRNPLKKLADKIVSNMESVNYFKKDYASNTRLGVTIDWSKGTMAVESNRK
jgi:hypothetical protein